MQTFKEYIAGNAFGFRMREALRHCIAIGGEGCIGTRGNEGGIVHKIGLVVAEIGCEFQTEVRKLGSCLGVHNKYRD